MADYANVRVVILAGGSGTRLWPLSRLQAPKQFLQILGKDTLLEETVNRVLPLMSRSQVTIVASEETAKGEGFRLLEGYDQILEPVARNTAAAIGAAAIRCQLGGGDPVMVVLPSDHLIRDIPAFQAALAAAVEGAEDGKLVMFGIPPTTPETGFGYIRARSGSWPRAVAAFHEKPDQQTAKGYLASRDYFWNSGMFVWRASAILREISLALPALHQVLADILQDSKGGSSFSSALKQHFPDAPSISIDHGVLEKSQNLFMVPGEFGWSDVGSWDAVYEISEQDRDRNSTSGNVIAVDCRNSLIRSHDRLVAVVDMDGVSVIETRDAVLVMRRGSSQKVRMIVDELSRGSGTEHLLHATVHRPWGSYTVLEEGPGFKIKRIEVSPGGRLSLQRHEHRSEHWVVTSGEATVTSGEAVSRLKANESAFIPIGTIHRLENLGSIPLQIIEVQVGRYVGEDDIQRFDDKYGRSSETYST